MSRLLSIVAFLMSLNASGQFIVKDVVHDNTGAPMAGVNVVNRSLRTK